MVGGAAGVAGASGVKAGAARAEAEKRAVGDRRKFRRSGAPDATEERDDAATGKPTGKIQERASTRELREGSRRSSRSLR